MVRAFITITSLLLFQGSFAQTKTLTEAEKASLDSMLKNDEFFNMMKSALKPKSYFEISATAGNSYFSVKNKRIEASQLESKLVITPVIAYNHKKGWGLSAAAFLTSFNGRSDFYQFSLTPSYTVLTSKKIAASVSYTRFFRRDGYNDAASPIQNDLYGTIYLKKPWLQPGLSLGFSGGKNTAYKYIDTVLFGVRRMFTDTAKTKIRSFSVSAFVQHSFEWFDVLKKDDGISVTPKIIVNAGSNRYTEKHYNPYSSFFKRILQRMKNVGRLQDNTSFELQSMAFNLDVNYLVGDFGFQPQVYFDYYLPDTTDKKFTCIYSFCISYTF